MCNITTWRYGDPRPVSIALPNIGDVFTTAIGSINDFYFGLKRKASDADDAIFSATKSGGEITVVGSDIVVDRTTLDYAKLKAGDSYLLCMAAQELPGGPFIEIEFQDSNAKLIEDAMVLIKPDKVRMNS